MGIYSFPDGGKGLQDYLNHLRHDMLIDGDPILCIVLIYVILKGLETKLISIFMVAVVLSVLLNGIIG